MKRILFSAIAAMVSLPAMAMTLNSPQQQRATEMFVPTVQVNRNCSGTVVATRATPEFIIETYVLTAKHCIENRNFTQDVYVPQYQDNRVVSELLYKAKVVSLYGSHDLALLKLMDTTALLIPATIADADEVLTEGEDTWTVGYSKALSRTVTDGTFGNREEIAFPDPVKPAEYFRATPQIAGGNSGGGLYHRDDVTGIYELIGVTSAVIPQSDFIGYYVPVNEIVKFLNQSIPAAKTTTPPSIIPVPTPRPDGQE